MQVGATRRGWGGVCIVLWAGIAVAAEPASTVLVTDFQAPSTATWAWARCGLPELAVEALNERGIVTVDRDLLSVVNTEHDLNAGKEVAQGGLQMGQWLGATFLLAGSVETVKVDRVRLSGTLTRVETAEQVGVCSVEGDYKKDLYALMRQWVAGLTKSVELGKQATVPEQVNPIKPEALMFFQQGVDACAAGKPALAVGFFLSAHAMDTRLQAAKQWEAHAYELGGLPQYAASVREHAATSNAAPPSSVANTLAPTQTIQRVVSVLTPLWLGDAKAAAVAMPTMPALRLSEEMAVLACKGVRLYRPESLSEAVAETDRQLSLRFNPRAVSRYARWLASDVVLYSTVTPLTKGKVGLEVGLMNALTAQRIKQVKRDVAPVHVSATLAALARECLDGWPQAEGLGRIDLPAQAALVPVSDEDVSRLPDFTLLVVALDARMRGVATLTQHQMLSDFYAVKGIPELAAIELEVVLRRVEVREPDMDALLTSVYWWINGYFYVSETQVEMGKRWGKNLLDISDVGVAAGVTVRNRVAALRTRLLSDYPDSMGTYAVLHMEAENAFRAGQWALCLTNIDAAMKVLERGERSGYVGRSSLELRYQKKGTTAILLNCLYLQSVSLNRLGDRVRSRQGFDQIQQMVEQNKTEAPFRFLSPSVSFDGSALTVSFGGGGPAATIELAIKKERDAWTADAGQQQTASATSQDATLSERERLLSERKVQTPEEYFQLMRDITQLWKAIPPSAHAQCVLADLAVMSVDKVGRLPADDRLVAVRELARAYLLVTGVDPDRLGENRSLAVIMPRLRRIVRYYRSAGLGLESLVWANAVLKKPVDPELGRELIASLVDELADCVTGPFEYLLSAKSCDVTFTVSDEDPNIRLVTNFFEQHKDIPGVSAAQAKFWQIIGERAEGFRRYSVWYAANIKARACYSAYVLTPRADCYAARLALSSCTQDVLLAAIQLRDDLGYSPNPVPFESWYSAGFLCVEEGAYDQALKSFQLFRETYNEGLLRNKGMRLDEIESDQSLVWSLEYLEGICLAATGHAAEAAPRFRRLSQRFGARPIYLWTSPTARGGGLFNFKPLGLLAAEELQKLHEDENAENRTLNNR